jgi:hypothetical protein
MRTSRLVKALVGLAAMDAVLSVFTASMVVATAACAIANKDDRVSEEKTDTVKDKVTKSEIM